MEKIVTRTHPERWEGPTGELDPGGSKVETAGFMTNKQKIDRLMAGGYVNANFRAAHFPPDEEVPDEIFAPQMYPDEIDAVNAARKIIAGATARQARKDAEKDRMDREKEQETPETPETTPTEGE